MNTISFWGKCSGFPYSQTDFSKDYKYQEFINNPGLYDYTENATYNSTSVNGSLGIEYEHKFNNNGHKLIAEIEGGAQKRYRNNNFLRIYDYYPERNKDKETVSDSKDYNFSGKINYSVPYHKNGMIEMGVEGFYTSEISVFRTDTLSGGTYVLDSLRYKDYAGSQGDLDGYITVQHKFGRFTIKGGLRSENRFLKYNVHNQPEHHDQNVYPGLFPSLHFSYATKSMHNFNLSYTRRVNYPQNSQLNTFVTYGEDSFSTGNGDLKSTYTNSVEGGWSKFFPKFGSVGLSAYFKNNKDEINNITDVVYADFFGRYVSYSMPVNSSESHQYGGSLYVMYRLKKFMTIRLNASAYQYYSETIFRDNEDAAVTDCFTYSFRLNFWAKLWKFLEINASGNYRSQTKTVFNETAPTYSINCGLRSDFWKRKISVFLNMQDIFNWGKRQNTYTNPYYATYSSRKYNSRFISVGITFRFGKIEMEKQARTGAYTG
ncbi:outer membrane beta-barrel family protein [Bacteroidales bacterium OttesenSCG-928-C03]|nr:outer membrane beta-barrel family protein [Bacteroidales bacterium OttesenSCG-928-C03]